VANQLWHVEIDGSIRSAYDMTLCLSFALCDASATPILGLSPFRISPAANQRFVACPAENALQVFLLGGNQPPNQKERKKKEKKEKERILEGMKKIKRYKRLADSRAMLLSPATCVSHHSPRH
jgi:hypothetical protein